MDEREDVPIDRLGGPLTSTRTLMRCSSSDRMLTNSGSATSISASREKRCARNAARMFSTYRQNRNEDSLSGCQGMQCPILHAE
jgi:hypothetical protein